MTAATGGRESESGNSGWLQRAAPAKINLYLHVVGRRADGYHLLDSLIAFAGVHDTVAVRRAPGQRGGGGGSGQFSLAVEGPRGGGLTADADNLVLRAAHRLAAAAGGAPATELRLVKRLPVASGVGGGSADAAATLSALAELWSVPSSVDLPAIALGLGADVPMCLGGRAAFVGGIGERLDPAPALPPAWLVLVNPGLPVSTPHVFGARIGGFSKADRFAGAPSDAADLAALLAHRRNDLEGAAQGLVPEIRDALAALQASEGNLIARMSGSGATCFGLYATDAAARAARQAIAAERPSWWVETAPLVEDTRGMATLEV